MLFFYAKRYGKHGAGLTLIEIIIVVAIIAILAAAVVHSYTQYKKRTYSNRALEELESIANAMALYVIDNNGAFPDDADRALPPGLEKYLTNENWPKAPWPGSVYDWDNWTIGGKKVYQISIRFCPISGPLAACKFPNEPWAKNFDLKSAYYYCIKGSCRSHSSMPSTHPGYCVNCTVQPAPPPP
ncbi:MAG: hypothetical protein A3D65_01235 [Candidatus Lloydbacteria bacterium RIFCSPHIGHO2_02_FULL_50_13]|uniref:Type II secretion system protein GspG C-terminal domain-containing protein n=1 Tax=Candidatus Lloydbacteria bacterium RIFCSPHIGHO2_02_FULL_50_13 TaxID=1798661 RepID=A0A1G2D4X6_9BACT|nr:MAG: hypothetical protein A3D65_01235 [Candidatus Lloydbacteria bacterium RIFCSPHIGHO2_02_FULL_50_13]